MYHIKKLVHSIYYAWRGVRYIFLHEQNFRIQIGITLALVIIMFFLPLTRSEIIILLCLAMFVLVLEIINSAMEKFIDVVKPRLTYQAEIIKDMLAAMVLIAATVSAVVGILILLPAVFELVEK